MTRDGKGIGGIDKLDYGWDMGRRIVGQGTKKGTIEREKGTVRKQSKADRER
jgi:hypothetical protein